MPLQLYTAPVVEPISRTEAKLHLRVDDSTEDSLIDALVQVAREHVESKTNRQLVCATYKLTRDTLPSVIPLARAPLVSVSSVTYVDFSGDTQTASSALYTTDKNSVPPDLHLVYNASWPSSRGGTNDVTVTYVTGYAAEFTAVAATDVCTISGRTLADADIIRLSNSGGALPAGLSVATDYHVRDWSSQTFKLAATAGGGAIDITGTGTGTHYVGVVPRPFISAIKLIVGHLFENRESVITGMTATELPLAVDSLLSALKVWYEVT